jgi:hypothetical protein
MWTTAPMMLLGAYLSRLGRLRRDRGYDCPTVDAHGHNRTRGSRRQAFRPMEPYPAGRDSTSSTLIWTSLPVHSGPLRMMIASEETVTPQTLDPLLREFVGRLASVTLVGVVPQVGFIEFFGAYYGLTTPGGMLAEDASAASRLARSAVAHVPPSIPTTHLAARSWDAALGMASKCDLFVVAGRLGSWQDRRGVSRFARRRVPTTGDRGRGQR